MPGVTICLLFMIALILAAVPVKAQSRSSQTTPRTWTNKDLDQLRAKDQLSIVGPYQPETSEAQAAGSAITPEQAAAEPVYNSRFEDPRWYEQQASAIQQQIDDTAATLDRARDTLEAARNLQPTSGGIDVTQGNIGVTPEESIARLEEQVRILRDEEDALADTARRNDIPPGALRGSN
jgi:hypothetical protein